MHANPGIRVLFEVTVTAFADKLVLEALFSIALGSQPKVRIPKIARRGATLCGSCKGNWATLTDTRKMAKI